MTTVHATRKPHQAAPPPQLGMYVHMHWAYRRPYAARTWRLEEWTGYLAGLRGLGYDLLQIWPMVEIMPQPVTDSDREHLDLMRRVIDLAHDLGLRVHVGASANVMGNAHAADFTFSERPYFPCEERVNPTDPHALERLMRARQACFSPLAAADGFWLIDSDPGGYPDTPAECFADLFLAHRRMLDALRPGIRLVYWMWQGWTRHTACDAAFQNAPQPCWREALEAIAAARPEPWGLLACWPGHMKVVRDLGLDERAAHFPYGAVEAEPSYPWTGCDPRAIRQALDGAAGLPGAPCHLANAQSHCLQLPHTYFFAQLARAGALEQLDLGDFGERVAPGCGEALAGAWRAMMSHDPRAVDGARRRLLEAGPRAVPPGGSLGGLCFHQPGRLVQDTALQLALRGSLLSLREAARGERQSAEELYRTFVHDVRAWTDRHGFSDWYYGPFRDLAHPALAEASTRMARGEQIRQALQNFDGHGQNGAFQRLLDALAGASADAISPSVD